MMTTMLFNFGMIFFVPQLFLIGLYGKSWHLPTPLPRGGIRRRSRKARKTDRAFNISRTG
jgi:hypothetical protein